MSVKTNLVEGKFLVAVRQNLDGRIGALSRKVAFRNTPIQRDKVLFMTYKNAYECNPKYIAEEILRRGLQWDLVWITPTNPGDCDPSQFPEGIRLVNRSSYRFFEELASARVWIDNSLNCLWVPFYKKPGQYYFETWHGSMGLKRVGDDDVQNPRWLEAARRVTKAADFCISDSKFETQVYRETHWPNTPILEFGHPRNDILCNLDSERRTALKVEVCEELGVSEDCKLAIYAPTFRDSGTLECYDVDIDRVANALGKRFGGTWKILVRMHFHDRKKILPSVSRASSAIDATQYLDMQELLAVVDAGITDYSSWSCDYVLTGRPCFIYATDRARYDNERGLYYPLEETPFPISEDNDQLEARILGFDMECYAHDCERFLQDRGSFEDGHASERVVDILEIIVDGGNN